MVEVVVEQVVVSTGILVVVLMSAHTKVVLRLECIISRSLPADWLLVF